MVVRMWNKIRCQQPIIQKLSKILPDSCVRKACKADGYFPKHFPLPTFWFLSKLLKLAADWNPDSWLWWEDGSVAVLEEWGVVPLLLPLDVFLVEGQVFKLWLDCMELASSAKYWQKNKMKRLWNISSPLSIINCYPIA